MLDTRILKSIAVCPLIGSFIVLQIDAVRAADVDDSCAGGLQNIGDSRALADLYQIPRRDYDFTPGGKAPATNNTLAALEVVTVAASAPVSARSSLAHVSIRGSASAAPVGLAPVAVRDALALPDVAEHCPNLCE